MNTRHRLCRVCRPVSMCALPILVLTCWTRPGCGAVPSDVRVELDCKIVPRTVGNGDMPLIVEMRKASGDPIWRAMKSVGDSIRVRGVKPGIYQLCLFGKMGQRCESVDLNPPADRRFYKVKMQLAGPEAVAGELIDRHVTIAELSVPKDARHQLSQAVEAELSGDSNDAIHHLKHALTIDPNYPEALNNLGVRLYHNHEYVKSIECLRKAVELKSHFYDAWANLGSVMLASGEFRDAIQVNLRALDLRPQDARINMQLGLNYYYVRDYAKATMYLKKAMIVDPLSANSPQLFLAQIAIFEKKGAEAAEYIRLFMKVHPNSPLVPQLKQALEEVESGRFVPMPSLDMNSDP